MGNQYGLARLKKPYAGDAFAWAGVDCSIFIR